MYPRTSSAVVLVALAACAVAGCTVGGEFPDAHYELDGAILARDAVTEAVCADGITIGRACETTAGCQDGCFCNGVEVCAAGVCAPGVEPCLDAIECTVDECDEPADRCVLMPDHAVCADSDPCNGSEVCDSSRGCRAGALPDCNDSDICTLDTCETAMGGCVHAMRDLDGDGTVDAECGGADCDDADPAISPGAVESCTGGRDDDCNGWVDGLDPGCIAREGACSDATALPGPGTHRLALPASAAGYLDATCGPDRFDAGTDGVAAVAWFRLDAPADVTIDVRDDSGMPIDGVRVVLRSLGACPYGPNEHCRLEPSIVRRGLAAGDWAIVVAGPPLYVLSRPADRPIDLVLSIAAPTTASIDYDRCEPSTRAVVPGETYVGSFADLSDDTLCGNGHRIEGPDGMGGWIDARTYRSREAVYRLTLDRRYLVVVDGSPARIVPACDWASCRVAPVGTDGRVLGAGSYYVVVEASAYDGDELGLVTGYSFRIDLRDPPPPLPGDRCEDPLEPGEALMLDSRGVFDSYAYLNDGLQACGFGASHPDLVRRIEVTEPRDVVISTMLGYWPSASYSLQRECGSQASALEGTCFGGPHRYRGVEPGTYFLVLGSNQPQAVDVSLEAPVMDTTNDRCADAIDIAGTWSGRASFWRASDDYSLCRAGALDVVYRLTLSERRRVRVLVPTGLWASLQSSCGGTRTIACAPGTADAVLDPGTYYVVAESFTEGEFPIDVLLTSP